MHGFCTVRIFHVRWSKSVNYSAIRAIFCNSGQQSQAKLRFYREGSASFRSSSSTAVSAAQRKPESPRWVKKSMTVYRIPEVYEQKTPKS